MAPLRARSTSRPAAARARASTSEEAKAAGAGRTANGTGWRGLQERAAEALHCRSIRQRGAHQPQVRCSPIEVGAAAADADALSERHPEELPLDPAVQEAHVGAEVVPQRPRLCCHGLRQIRRAAVDLHGHRVAVQGQVPLHLGQGGRLHEEGQRGRRAQPRLGDGHQAGEDALQFTEVPQVCGDDRFVQQQVLVLAQVAGAHVASRRVLLEEAPGETLPSVQAGQVGLGEVIHDRLPEPGRREAREECVAAEAAGGAIGRQVGLLCRAQQLSRIWADLETGVNDWPGWREAAAASSRDSYLCQVDQHERRESLGQEGEVAPAVLEGGDVEPHQLPRPVGLSQADAALQGPVRVGHGQQVCQLADPRADAQVKVDGQRQAADRLPEELLGRHRLVRQRRRAPRSTVPVVQQRCQALRARGRCAAPLAVAEQQRLAPPRRVGVEGERQSQRRGAEFGGTLAAQGREHLVQRLGGLGQGAGRREVRRLLRDPLRLHVVRKHALLAGELHRHPLLGLRLPACRGGHDHQALEGGVRVAQQTEQLVGRLVVSQGQGRRRPCCVALLPVCQAVQHEGLGGVEQGHGVGPAEVGLPDAVLAGRARNHGGPHVSNQQRETDGGVGNR